MLIDKAHTQMTRVCVRVLAAVKASIAVFSKRQHLQGAEHEGSLGPPSPIALAISAYLVSDKMHVIRRDNVKLDIKSFLTNRQRAVDYLNTRVQLYIVDGSAVKRRSSACPFE